MFGLDKSRPCGDGSFVEMFRGNPGPGDTPGAVRVFDFSDENLRGTSPEIEAREWAAYQAMGEHPNLMRVWDRAFDTENDAAYWWCEFIEGGELRSINIPMPVDRARNIMQQLLLVLHHMHSRGVVHNDLKAENILLRDSSGEDNSVVVIDFNLSVLHERDRNLRGSWHCSAPELHGNIKVSPSPASDMWALGILLYELLTTQEAFATGLSVRDYASGQKDAAPVWGRARQWDKCAVDLVRQLLEVNPEKRITSAMAARHAFLTSSSNGQHDDDDDATARDN